MKQNALGTRLVIFFGVLMLIGGLGWLWWQDGTGAVDNSDSTPITFSVKSGEGVRAIAAKLAQQNLIRSSTGFYILVKFLGIERGIQAGDFRLNKAMNAQQIARELTHGIADTWVTTLEGWRDEEIATKLAKEFDLPEKEFLQRAREGYMFPDTYLIPHDATAAGIVTMFLQNFDKKVTRQMREDAKKQGLTLDGTIILASIVEREGRTDDDRPVIAGILLKRIKADWPLQADSTLQYALGYQAQEKTWWKKAIYDEDKQIASLYNTYSNKGLPPGPIGNPGLAAIQAVIYPKETEYWYYIHDTNGAVHYAKTLDEHEANIAKYLR